MKRNITLLALLLVTVFASNGKLHAQEAKPVYVKGTELTLIGKIFPGKETYHRLDTAQYSNLPKHIKNLLTDPAGMALCFTTNSTSISAKWCNSTNKQYPNLTAYANKGLDLYIRKNGKWQFAGAAAPKAQCSDGVLVKNLGSGEKECIVYLPLYDIINDVEIGTDAGSTIKAMPSPFKRRVLIYGSSILQGAAASRPGMAYSSRLSRETGIEFTNFGLSGSAKMEKEVADVVAAVPADAYVLDCVPNSSPQQVTERTAYLVNTIRKAHPKAPIIMVQSIVRESGFMDQVVGQRVQEQNDNYKKQFTALQQAGVKDLYFITADNLMGDDHEGSVDGTHPNDLGFDRMLKKLKPEITTILKKYGITGN